MKLKKYNTFFHTKNKKKPRVEDIRCINCGELGHVYINCSHPIKSYGIICIKSNINLNELIKIQERLNNNKCSLIDRDVLNNYYQKIKNYNFNNLRESIHFLTIKRRNTIAIIEFIRGKYKIKNYKYLLTLFYQMTNKEKDDLLNQSFDFNWKKVWLLNDINQETHIKEYNTSKKKYLLLKDGIVSDNIEVNIKKLIQFSGNKYENSEWGFPKGRKNLDETEIECAIREFEEETTIKPCDYNFLNLNTLEELYMSTNKVKYKHIYYISQYNNNIDTTSKKLNENQNVEITDIKWLKHDEMLNNIRDYSIEKINVLNTIYYNIINLVLDTKRKIEDTI